MSAVDTSVDVRSDADTSGDGAAGGEGAAAALARKYATLVAWRRARDESGALAGRDELRRLAREFPGALRELDTLPMEVLEARAAALAGARPGEACEPWAEWMHAYHRVARAALRIKPRVAARPALAEVGAADALAREVSAEVGIEVDGAFVRAVARPAGGRLVPVLLAWVGAHLDAEPAAIRAALFPSLRAAPDDRWMRTDSA